MGIYLTSDLHFGHDRDFIYQARGFDSIEEHDQKLIDNFNSIIQKDDIVYILGDLYLGDKEHGLHCIKQLNGKLHIICGNHDSFSKIDAYKELPNVKEVLYADLIKYKKFLFYLSHYPTYMGNYDQQMSKEWCLHGHTHATAAFSDIDKNYNVNIDAHNNYPISIEQIYQEIHDYWKTK